MSIAAYVQRKQEEHRITQLSSELWNSKNKEILTLFATLLKQNGYIQEELSPTIFLFKNEEVASEVAISFSVDLYLFAKIEVDSHLLGYIKIEKAPHNWTFTQCDRDMNLTGIASSDLSTILNRIFKFA